MGDYGQMDKKPRLVWWTRVSRQRFGGLGVTELEWLNKKFYNWSLRLAMEQGAFWKGVIREQYGEQEGGLCTHDTRGRFGLGFWKAIFSSWSFVSINLSFEVGNG